MFFNQHETLVVVRQHHKEVAQSFREANHARRQNQQKLVVHPFNLRIPRIRVRIYFKPEKSVAGYNSVSQTL